MGLQISRCVTKEDTWLQDTAWSLPEQTERTGEDEKHLQTREPAVTGVHLWSEEQQNLTVRSKEEKNEHQQAAVNPLETSQNSAAAQQDGPFPACITTLAELSPLRHASLAFERATFWA